MTKIHQTEDSTNPVEIQSDVVKVEQSLPTETKKEPKKQQPKELPKDVSSPSTDQEHEEYSKQQLELDQLEQEVVKPEIGTPHVLLVPGPRHIQIAPEQDEPLYLEKKSKDLVAKMKWYDEKKREKVFSSSKFFMNRLVYDCHGAIKKHPFHRHHHYNFEDAEDGEPVGPTTESVEAAAKATSYAADKKKKLELYYTLQGSEDSTLQFESRFESGNLKKATQVYEHEYDLKLKFDVNTTGHTQWFFFAVSNTKKNKKYKFNIVNLMKADSLFNYGMQPVIYSEKGAKLKGKGWFRDGYDICYYKNDTKRSKKSNYYTLTWSYQFEHENDTVYFAHCYPYRYSDLQNYLTKLEKDKERSVFVKRSLMGKSLAGNRLDLLTITNHNSSEEIIERRKRAIISARIHPGESNSSWMMKGVIDFLTSKDVEAVILRDNFVIEVVPMINPDGVINGNYRCSLAGVDLNRHWDNPQQELHPTIFHLKKFIKKVNEEKNLIVYCDLHGHSRKSNIFMYGCTSKKRKAKLEIKMFPLLVSKMIDYFSFEDCSFNLLASKNNTARVVCHTELNVKNSFTMEASFCGADKGTKATKHFNTRDLENMGHALCRTIWHYTAKDTKWLYDELELKFPRKVTGEAAVKEQEEKEEKKELEVKKTFADLQTEPESSFSIGSDSDVHEYTIRKRKKPLKKKLGQRGALKKKEPEEEETSLGETSGSDYIEESDVTSVSTVSSTSRPKSQVERKGSKKGDVKEVGKTTTEETKQATTTQPPPTSSSTPLFVGLFIMAILAMIVQYIILKR